MRVQVFQYIVESPSPGHRVVERVVLCSPRYNLSKLILNILVTSLFSRVLTGLTISPWGYISFGWKFLGALRR